MSQLLDALARWKPFTAIVVGDFMLDEVVSGDVDRLANDAPVPVVLVKQTTQTPGGAANVCLDLVALKGRVFAVGVTGSDHAGDRLRDLLSSSGVDSAGVLVDADRPTTVKRSIVGLAQHRHAQKMFRLDYESKEAVGAEVERRLLAHVETALDKALRDAGARGEDVASVVVCIEDYHKGVCTPRVCQGVIGLCRARGVEVLVDPGAIADYARYRGATTITPNRSEAMLATSGTLSVGGEIKPPAATKGHTPEDFVEIASYLVQTLDLRTAVITLDKHGALLLERGDDGTPGEAQSIPTTARKVYDVTGAGDMVLAALAAARANGLAWADSVRFANAAAGLEVEEFGVVPIPLERIHQDLLRREAATRGKLRTLDQLKVEITALRQHAKTTGSTPPKVVFTNGVFDVLHAGHAALLRRAKDLGDYLVVAINTDTKVRQYKGPNRPINDESLRAFVLSQLESVDAVIVFEQDTPIDVIDALRPDVLAKGDEYADTQIPGAALVKSYGGAVHRLPMAPGLSTTGVLRAMNDPRAETTSSQTHRARFIDDKPPA